MRNPGIHVVLVAALALAACAPAAPSTPTGGQRADEQRAEQQSIRTAFSSLPATITPEHFSGWPFMNWPMYDNLTQFGPNFEPRPSVAQSWDLSADGRAWRFRIRSDMRWPNGDPLTAEDVAFSLRTALERNWPARTFFASVTSVTAIDTTTVEMALRQQDVSIPAAGQFLWIIPARYFQQVGVDGFRQRPMGSGPYELVEFQPGQLIRYRKRSEPHAFRQPIATEISVAQIIDAQQRLNGIRSGELDMSHMLLSAEQMDIANRESLQLQRLNNDTSIVVLMPLGTAASRNSPLTDRRVRQALNYAVDKETIMRTVLRGAHEPSGQIGIPSSPYWDPTARVWPFDPARARALLAEAGYPNGFSLTMDFTAAAMAVEVALAVQAALRDIGVEVSIRTLEPATFIDAANARNNQGRSDLFPTTFSDSNGFFTGSRNLLGCNRPQPNMPAAEFYCDPEWDRLMDQAVVERDAARRAEILRQANRVQREAVPGIFFATRSSFVVQSPKIRGFQYAVPSAWNLDSVYKVR